MGIFGYFCNCRRILPLSPQFFCEPSLCFCQGSCPWRLIRWKGVSVRKEWGKDRVYFLHEGAWGSISFKDIWLIAWPIQRWKMFTSFISWEEGTESKKYVCFHLLPFSPSSIRPPALSSSPQGRRAGGAGTGSGEQPFSARASQTQSQDALLVFSWKLEHFSKWKIFCQDVLFCPKHSFPENCFEE